MNRLLVAILCGTALIPAPVAGQPAAVLAADTILSPAGGLRVLLLGAPGEGVAALRISVPLVEGPTEAGAGLLLRHLALQRIQGLARPIGARVSASRTPWGLAYTVEGAAADFEYLAYLIREAVAAPDARVTSLSSARIRLEQAIANGEETPGGLLRARLRRSVAPDAPSATGSRAALPYLGPARLREVWTRSHQASGMTLVVSAPFVPEVVLAATRGLGSPEEDAGPPLDAPAQNSPPEGGDTQPIRYWYGEAYRGGVSGDPRGRVCALLVSRQMRMDAGAFEAAVELWELPQGWALALTGAAYRSARSEMRRSVSGAMENTRTGLSPGNVADAVSRIRRQVLHQARTPAGLVTVVGRAVEASGDPLAAQKQLMALDDIDLASMRDFLDELILRGPVVAEIQP